jgi:hypothetical protein
MKTNNTFKNFLKIQNRVKVKSLFVVNAIPTCSQNENSILSMVYKYQFILFIIKLNIWIILYIIIKII